MATIRKMLRDEKSGEDVRGTVVEVVEATEVFSHILLVDKVLEVCDGATGPRQLTEKDLAWLRDFLCTGSP